jgi:hypothetical protein
MVPAFHALLNNCRVYLFNGRHSNIRLSGSRHMVD